MVAALLNRGAHSSSLADRLADLGAGENTLCLAGVLVKGLRVCAVFRTGCLFADPAQDGFMACSEEVAQFSHALKVKVAIGPSVLFLL
jgi:hypothetical protein